MEILNIGPLELIIVLLIMFILLGPKEMILTAQRIGSWIRRFVRSPMWREIMGYSQDIRELPKKLMDETGLEDTLKEVQESTQSAVKDINQSVKEAADAARVPEAEHLHLDTTVPAAEKTKPAASPAKAVDEPTQATSNEIKPPAAAETVETETEPATAPAASTVEEDAAQAAPETQMPEAESPAAGEIVDGQVDPTGAESEPALPAALVSTGVEPGPAETLPAAVVPVGQTVEEGTGAVEKPVRKPRRKSTPAQKTADSVEALENPPAAESAVVPEGPAPEDQPVVTAPRKPRRKKAAAGEQDAGAAVDTAAANAAEIPTSESTPVKKTRTRRTQAVQPDPQEPQASSQEASSKPRTRRSGTRRSGARMYPTSDAEEANPSDGDGPASEPTAVVPTVIDMGPAGEPLPKSNNGSGMHEEEDSGQSKQTEHAS